MVFYADEAKVRSRRGLFGSTLACYVSKLVAVVAANLVLTAAAATAAATARAVTSSVVSCTTSKHQHIQLSIDQHTAHKQ